MIVPNPKVPQFLKDEKLTLTAKDCDRIAPHMGNWLRIHAYAKSLKDDGAREELGKMMLHELMFDRRLHVLTRLKGQRDGIRKKTEEQQLYQCGPFVI